MVTPGEALARILEHIPAPDATERVPLSEAHGRRLAVPVRSDVDLPPFEKSMMDGFALASASAAQAPARLRIRGESRAGAPFAGSVPAGECVEIFTGAELPEGCDAVEMIENVRRDDAWIELERPVARGQHVSHTSEILAAGRVVYSPRRRLGAADLSVLASCGCDPVEVFRRVRVSILTTGDELVTPRQTPARGQIREGNTYFLAAACAELGAAIVRSAIVPDQPAALESAFRAALEDSDVLVTTGGVSVGKYDLVGAAFERLGVEPILHKVAVKPGKPIWFGMRERTPVFGLPGNPVSTLLGFELFVRAALARLAGDEPELERERLRRGRWLGPLERSGDRQNNLPALCRSGADGVAELEPLAYRGSADIVAAARAHALVVIPALGQIRPGEMVEYRPLGSYVGNA